MASPSEPTSCYFVANLGNPDSAVAERLERWAEASCAEHTLRRHEDGSVTLYTSRAAAKSARQYQSLLRTLSSHWKMSLGKLDRGWLSLLTEDEYRAVVGQAHESTEHTESEVTPHNQCEVNRPDAQHEPRARCMYRLSLSDGFDERAQTLYDSIRASGVLQQPHTVVRAA